MYDLTLGDKLPEGKNFAFCLMFCCYQLDTFLILSKSLRYCEAKIGPMSNKNTNILPNLKVIENILMRCKGNL